MIILDEAPKLILPDHYEAKRPAIIRPGVDLASYFPVEIDRNTRRVIVKELAKRGLIDDRAKIVHFLDKADDPVRAAIPFGMFVKKAVPTLSYRGQADIASGTTYTYTSFAYGANYQLLVIVFQGRTSSGNPRTVNSMTVDGNSATNVTNLGVASHCIAEIWQIAGPTSSSGNIVVTMSGTFTQAAVTVWGLNNLNSTTAKDTSITGFTGVTTRNANVDTTPGDLVIAGFTINNGSLLTSSWSGITEQYDSVISSGSNSKSGGYHIATSTETPRTISATASAAPNNTTITSAVWG